MKSYIEQETKAIVTEEMIERAVESKINTLDRQFMRSGMTQEVYDEKMNDIRQWADSQYNARRCDDECTVCGKGFDTSALYR